MEKNKTTEVNEELFHIDEEFDKQVRQMKVLERLARIRIEVQNSLETISGYNDTDDYTYFELKDFMPQVNKIFLKYRVIGKFFFPSTEQSQLDIINLDDYEDKVSFTMIRRPYNMQNQMQAEGAINTYSKRYLYMNALEICENDQLNCSKPKVENKETPAEKNTVNMIYFLAKQLMKSGDKDTVAKTKSIMKSEGFDSLKDISTNVFSEKKGTQIIKNLYSIMMEYKMKENQQEVQNKKQQEEREINQKLQTQKVQNDYSYTAKELPNGEIDITSDLSLDDDMEL